jgi:hypothetical protein
MVEVYLHSTCLHGAVYHELNTGTTVYAETINLTIKTNCPLRSVVFVDRVRAEYHQEISWAIAY